MCIRDRFILSADILDKKSKLRSFFEKDKKCVCIPFYPDNEQTLSKLAFNFLREKNISLSSSDINLVVSKSNGDREILLSELDKLEYYSKNGKKITTEHIMKLTNLIENFSISLNSSILYAIPPPVPASVKEGRSIAGSPISLTVRAPSSSVDTK